MKGGGGGPKTVILEVIHSSNSHRKLLQLLQP